MLAVYRTYNIIIGLKVQLYDTNSKYLEKVKKTPSFWAVAYLINKDKFANFEV